MEKIDRIQEAICYLKGRGIISNQQDIVDKMGMNKSSVSLALNGNIRYLTDSFIRKFNVSFSSIFNEEWLLRGIGEMLKSNNVKVIEKESEIIEAQNNGITLLPEVDFKFSAGQTKLININEDISRYWYLPDCRDCEGVAQVVGNSMSPALPSGCWVALKKYTMPTSNPNTIPFGNVFGVVVEDEVTSEYHGHIKVLRRHKDKDLASKYWIAHSINDNEFDDFDIEIEKVRSLWLVKQHIVSDILL